MMTMWEYQQCAETFICAADRIERDVFDDVASETCVGRL